MEYIEYQLEELHKSIYSCNRCPLAISRNKAVPGEGPSNAEIMIIGEGPGEENDKTGRPFVGRGGQILDKYLLEATLNREELFLTNIIKCKMPHNATPTSTIIKQCQKYLHQQLNLINPKILITLGLPAAKVVLKESLGTLQEPIKYMFKIINTRQ